MATLNKDGSIDFYIMCLEAHCCYLQQYVLPFILTSKITIAILFTMSYYPYRTSFH